MNYQNKNVAITGASGFLGSKIAIALENAGANVKHLTGDIRDPLTFEPLDYTYDYLFHFAAPSSQILFKRQPEYSIDTTITGFLNAIRACENNGIKLIYPSTGSLSSNTSNEYSRSKKICEDVAIGGNIDSLGMRIFATYGPGEGHKRDYASVPYLFIREVLAGRQPIIFGDGQQKRDFIYIDDVVAAVLTLAERCNDKVIDVGSGVSHSFNQIIEEIGNSKGMQSQWVKPIYVGRPAGYIEETSADVTRLHDFYEPIIDFKDGIERIVIHEQSNRYYDNKPSD